MGRPKKNTIDEKYVYRFLDLFVDKLCSISFLHPNIITLFGLPIIYLLYLEFMKKKPNIYLVLFLMILRHYIDCLDGEVARRCCKQSEFGSYLDMIVDTIFIILMLYVFIRIIFPRFYNKKHSLTIFIAIYLGILLFNINTEPGNNHKPRSKFSKLYNQNILLVQILLWLLWLFFR